MKRLVACIVLVGGIAALTGIDAPYSVAQVKKDAKKDAATATIEIGEGKDGKFRWGLRNAEGKYVGGSGLVGYATEKEARASIDEFKKLLATAKITMKKGDGKDKPKDK